MRGLGGGALLSAPGLDSPIPSTGSSTFVLMAHWDQRWWVCQDGIPALRRGSVCGRLGGEHPSNHHSKARPKTCEHTTGSTSSFSFPPLTWRSVRTNLLSLPGGKNIISNNEWAFSHVDSYGSLANQVDDIGIACEMVMSSNICKK